MNRIITILFVTTLLCANATAWQDDINAWANNDNNAWHDHQDKVAGWADDRERQQQDTLDKWADDRKRDKERRDIEQMVDKKIRSADKDRSNYHAPVSDFPPRCPDVEQTPMLHSMWLVGMLVVIVLWRRKG